MASYWTYLKYLYAPGILFFVAGIVIQNFATTSSLTSLILVTTGILILISWLILFLKLKSFSSIKRSNHSNFNRILYTLAFLLTLILLNYLASCYSFKLDLSENKLYTLAPQSQIILQSLSKPTKVYVFLKEIDTTDKELLANYRSYNNNFQFVFIDPEMQPALARQFSSKPLGTVYLEYGNKRQQVQDLRINPQGEPSEKISEISLTNALESIQNNTQGTIYILQGHQEPTLFTSNNTISEGVKALEDRGYRVKPLNLIQQTNFPKDITSLLIIGPKKTLLASEVKLIKQYVDQGGNIMLLIDPQTDPGLDKLLKEWGVKLDPRLVIDASGRGSQVGLGPESPIISQYGNHPITQAFQNGDSIFPLSRPIQVVKLKEVENFPLLKTDNKMWATAKIERDKIIFNPQTDLTGPFNLGYALTKNVTDKQSKMIVVGSSTFATNGWFSRLLDGDFFINSIEWLSQAPEHQLTIKPKEASNRRINLSLIQSSFLTWVALIIVPLFGLILAIFFWWKRR